MCRSLWRLPGFDCLPHSSSDVGGRILPVWKNPLDPFQPDPEGLAYRPLDLGYPHAGPPPERGRSPTPTPVWETEDMLK